MVHSRQKKGEAGLPDAAAEADPIAAEAFQRVFGSEEEISTVCGSTVGELAFRMLPDAFIWIEFRGIGGKAFEAEAGESFAEFLDRSSLMGGAVVPEDDDSPTKVPEKMAYEVTDFSVLDVLEVKGEVQPQVSATWTHGDRRDRGDLVPLCEMANGRRFAHGGPRLPYDRDQEEAGLVRENEVGAQPRSVFFIRGHSSRRQRSISASSRSAARRWGF